MKPGSVLLTLALNFALISLLAVGGINATLPEMQRLVVETEGWMSAKEFANLFAIAQAAPGPNFFVVTLIGWQVAGLPGAITSTLAVCLPSCLLTYGVVHLWERFKDRPWRAIVQNGIAPVTVGLLASSGWLLARSADHNLAAVALTLTSAWISYRTRINPLWTMAAGALLGMGGIV